MKAGTREGGNARNEEAEKPRNREAKKLRIGEAELDAVKTFISGVLVFRQSIAFALSLYVVIEGRSAGILLVAAMWA